MRSSLNTDTPNAAPGEFAPLRIGSLEVHPPVVLAPMAGVTNAPFRTICRRFSDQRCLYVSEMITARSLAMRHEKTLRLAGFGPDEGKGLRSIQLYGTEPVSLGEAARILVEELDVDHVDLNFGCPVRKVTAAGGGAAIPARPKLLARLVRSVVRAANGRAPVTIKFRKGIDDSLLTFHDAAQVAVDEGCSAVALHARTAAQLYAGDADWNAIGELKARIGSQLPVLGNGDVFEAHDALRMMRATGCDGVVVGRGCLGRPWLFRDLCDAFDGREPRTPPDSGEILDVVREHATLLTEWFSERTAMHHMRKHVGWYLKTFPGARRMLPDLFRVETRAQLDELLAQIPVDMPFPEAGLRARRCKGGRTQTVSLPQGFLDGRDEEDRVWADDAAADAAALHGG
jgi:nifR3 family TIM-barrel protein